MYQQNQTEQTRIIVTQEQENKRLCDHVDDHVANVLSDDDEAGEEGAGELTLSSEADGSESEARDSASSTLLQVNVSKCKLISYCIVLQTSFILHHAPYGIIPTYTTSTHDSNSAHHAN